MGTVLCGDRRTRISAAPRPVLESVIENELGIPAERQMWM